MSSNDRHVPVVGVSCCSRVISGALFHTVFDKYLTALRTHAKCESLLLPALDESINSEKRCDLLLNKLDGILLTGGRSMVAPEHYGSTQEDSDTLYDHRRDATTLCLVRRAVALDIPIFGICRGLQEMCCALGGTLQQSIATGNDGIDHRAPQGVPYEEKYLPHHEVSTTPGGRMGDILSSAGLPTRFAVNSLHTQGIAQLPETMSVEAVANDGLVEAASVTHSDTFALGVQWHAEWYVNQNPINRILFEAFGAACRQAANTQMDAPTNSIR